MIVELGSKAKAFIPIELVITVQTKEEAQALYAVCNKAQNVRLLGEAAHTICEILGNGFHVAHGHIANGVSHNDFYTISTAEKMVQYESQAKDTERLNFLEKLLQRKHYTGRCILRESRQGRGFRLHETSMTTGNSATVRDAIDVAHAKYMEFKTL